MKLAYWLSLLQDLDFGHKGLPILCDLPIIGYLCSTTRTEEVKSELVFFITPRIIKRKEYTVILPPGERKRLKP